jgi:hypothetical protein
VSKQSRIASFGLAAALVVAGAVCAAVLAGATGQIIALPLIGIGLVLATSLVFLEVGLSEDRERARERARARKVRAGKRAGPPSRPRRWSIERSRGHRHHLR